MERRDLFINDLYAVTSRWLRRGRYTPTLDEFDDRSDLSCYRIISFDQPKRYDGKVAGGYRGQVKAVRCHPETHEAIGGEEWIKLRSIVAPWADFVEFSEPADSPETRLIKQAKAQIEQVDRQTTEDARAAVGRLTRLVFPDLGDKYRDPAERHARASYNDDATLVSDLSQNVDLKGYELAALLHLAIGFDLSFPDEVADQHRAVREAQAVIKERKAQRREQFLAQEAEWEAFVKAGREAAAAAGKRYREPQRPPRAAYVYKAPDAKGPPVTAL